jgi:hypothetical protein
VERKSHSQRRVRWSTSTCKIQTETNKSHVKPRLTGGHATQTARTRAALFLNPCCTLNRSSLRISKKRSERPSRDRCAPRDGASHDLLRVQTPHGRRTERLSLEGDAEGEPARRPRMDGKLHRINTPRGPPTPSKTPPQSKARRRTARAYKKTKQHPLIPIHNSENDQEQT